MHSSIAVLPLELSFHGRVRATVNHPMTGDQAWRNPVTLLILMSVAMPVAFSTWSVLLNNFVVERAAFTGVEIGILQSLREVPGLLSVSVVLVLLIIREQSLALVSLAVLGIGVAITGFFPSALGLYCTTLLLSLGFHYFEAIKQSLSLQWLSHDEAPRILGRLIAAGSVTSLVVYSLLWVCIEILKLDYVVMLLVAGGVCALLAIAICLAFPEFPSKTPQHKTLVLRRRYWLYYALIFFSGARRQIFIVFAAFLMVEKFGYSAGQITLLFLFNYAFNWFFAERIGRIIHVIGERRAMSVEYGGLIIVFSAYGLVQNAHVAAVLYIIDHMFFAMYIAMNTYFHKIADPRDLASSAGVTSTINHIAAVIVPATLGLVWMSSQALVFYIGTGFALCSLLLVQNIPSRPSPGNETIIALPKRFTRH